MSDRLDHSFHPAVVVGYDGTETAAHALRWAAREATERGAAVRVIIVEPEPVPVGWHSTPTSLAGSATERAVVSDARRLLADVAGPDLVADVQVHHGDVARHLVEGSRDASMLVLGSRGHLGLVGALTGSVSRICVRDAVVPVVLLGPHAGDSPEVRVVVPSSNAAEPGPAVAWAVQRAMTQGHDLLLLDRWGVPAMASDLEFGERREQAHAEAKQRHEATLDALRKAVAGRVGVSGRLVEGRGQDVEFEATHHSDLLVVAREDREHRPALTYERCPVVLVPGTAS